MAARIEVLRITAVDAAEQYGQRIGMAGNGHEMDMVGHQAETKDPDTTIREVGAEQVELHLPVLAGVKNRLTAGSALNDVIGKFGLHAACVSRHRTR
jgi:hypothetical protein